MSHGLSLVAGAEEFSADISSNDYVTYWAWVATIKAEEDVSGPIPEESGAGKVHT